MFSTICCIISIVCFISTFGCHETIKAGDPLDYPAYLSHPLLCAIPYVSGFVLAVIPECMIFEIEWYWMFLINIAIVFISAPTITKIYLVRMASGRGLGRDGAYAFIIALGTLLLGIIFA